MDSLPVFPVVIGVTGHCDIAPDAEQAIRASVRALLKDWHFWFDPGLYILTALADGGDQLVADEARSLNIPIIAVAPMPLCRYRGTMRHRDKFDTHWDNAALRLILPELTGSEADFNDRHFEQLGVLLARRSHLLLALWSGVQDPLDRCGTSAVVRMRVEGDRGAAAFRGGSMFRGVDSLLDMTYRGPILNILTSREHHATPGAGTCALLGLPDQSGQVRVSTGGPGSGNPYWKSVPVDPSKAFVAIRDWGVTDLELIRVLNGKIGAFDTADRKIFARQLSYLNVNGLPAEAQSGTRILTRLQAAADTAAQAYQVPLLGNFVPARSVCEMVENASNAWRTTGRLPRSGAAFIFAAAVPLAVLFFEIYVHHHGDPLGLVMLILYFLVFGGATGYYEFYVSAQEWQNRFQDYRALAEAMRVQLYWAASALPAAVSDHYLRKQIGELGWIQFALRGPALWAAALAGTVAAPSRDTVREGWIDDQKKYFGSKAPLHRHADRRCRAWMKLFAYLALGVSALLLALDSRAGELLSGPRFSGFWELLHQYHDAVVVTAAALPALVAFFSVSRDLRAYEPHAHSYALMFHMFDRAATVGAGSHDGEAAFQDLVRELGREALAENAEWLVEHRNRKIEHRS